MQAAGHMNTVETNLELNQACRQQKEVISDKYNHAHA